MDKHHRHIEDHILVKVITGQGSEEEVSQVNLWLNETEENQNYYNELEITWILSAKNQKSPVFNSNEAWKKVEEKLIPKQDQHKVSPKYEVKSKKSKKTIYYISAIAAVLIVALFISQLLFIKETPPPTLIVSQETPISQTLTDGSKISLNEASQLSYLEDFNKENRTVVLQGEAFFDIKRDTKKPFIIKSSIGNIKVLGTSFNVRAHDNSNFEVHVETGLVQLFSLSKDNKDTNSIFLEAGSKGIINYQNGELYKFENKDPAALFWLNQKLDFNKTPLSEVFSILREKYNIEIEFDDRLISNCKLSAKFENDNIETIIEVISTTFNFEIEKSKANQIKVLANDPDCPAENI
tara:strand:+ start:56579 stop:57634 length:1056 start_codon:yes stop_codon:yes gene_type:complete